MIPWLFWGAGLAVGWGVTVGLSKMAGAPPEVTMLLGVVLGSAFSLSGHVVGGVVERRQR